MSVAVSEMKMEGKGGPRDAVGDSSAPVNTRTRRDSIEFV